MLPAVDSQGHHRSSHCSQLIPAVQHKAEVLFFHVKGHTLKSFPWEIEHHPKFRPEGTRQVIYVRVGYRQHQLEQTRTETVSLCLIAGYSDFSSDSD